MRHTLPQPVNFGLPKAALREKMQDLSLATSAIKKVRYIFLTHLIFSSFYSLLIIFCTICIPLTACQPNKPIKDTLSAI